MAASPHASEDDDYNSDDVNPQIYLFVSNGCCVAARPSWTVERACWAVDDKSPTPVVSSTAVRALKKRASGRYLPFDQTLREVGITQDCNLIEGFLELGGLVRNVTIQNDVDDSFFPYSFRLPVSVHGQCVADFLDRCASRIGGSGGVGLTLTRSTSTDPEEEEVRFSHLIMDPDDLVLPDYQYLLRTGVIVKSVAKR
jgi:hypothetical protein